MSTNSIHLNVHSYVYFKIHQNISCSILHLVSFKFFLWVNVLYISKEVKSEYRLITDNHCVYIQRIVWGFSFSIQCSVIVCILWMAFFSGELDWVDHY